MYVRLSYSTCKTFNFLHLIIEVSGIKFTQTSVQEQISQRTSERFVKFDFCKQIKSMYKKLFMKKTMHIPQNTLRTLP